MINAGKKEVRIRAMVGRKTKDRSHSAQYEHQIVGPKPVVK